MQTVLASFIILIATLYVAKQWLPHPLKQRFFQMFGKNLVAKSNSGCGSCSTCGSCSSEKNTAQSVRKIMITRRKYSP